MSNSATLWTVAPQAPLSIGFPRQGYWSGLPFAEKEKIQRKEGEKKKKFQQPSFSQTKTYFSCQLTWLKLSYFSYL